MSFIFIFKSATLTYVTSCQYVILERAIKECLGINFVCRYTGGSNVWGGWFLAGNQGNHQNFVPSLISKNLSLIFMGMKQERNISLEKNPKMVDKKIWVIQNRRFSSVFLKLLGIYGCEAVQHKRKNSLKTPKIHFLPVFEIMLDNLKTI